MEGDRERDRINEDSINQSFQLIKHASSNRNSPREDVNNCDE